jgi:uncharacterized protein
VFSSYGAFNLSFAMIYLPGSGIMAAYTDQNGQLNEQFPQALALYLWAWFILTALFTIAAMRSSWVLFLDLVALDLVLILLPCGYMLDSSSLLKAGYSMGFVVAFLSCKSRAFSRCLSYLPANRLGGSRWTLVRRHYSFRFANVCDA